MLAPEVWNIHNKETLKNEYKSDFKLYKTDTIDNLIHTHYFNHSVAVTITSSEFPHEIINILENDNDYYLIHDVIVSDFYTSIFIESFILKGELTLLSINEENSFAITPSRHLVLRVEENTYLSLGIDGKRTKILGDDHYLINLDLNNKHFVSGKLHNRYHKNFINSNLRFDVIISWEPYDTTICPSSIASYFHKKSYKVSLCSPKHTLYEKFEETLPSFISDEPEDFLHWFGVHIIETNNESKKASELSKSNIVTHKWTGFFTSARILNLWKYLKKEKENLKPDETWFSLYVSGFHNSPLSISSDGCCFDHCDDFFTIFFTNDRCIVYPKKSIKTKSSP